MNQPLNEKNKWAQRDEKIVYEMMFLMLHQFDHDRSD